MNERDERRPRMPRQLVAQRRRAVRRQFRDQLLRQRSKAVRGLGGPLALALVLRLGLRFVLGADEAAFDPHRAVIFGDREGGQLLKIHRALAVEVSELGAHRA